MKKHIDIFFEVSDPEIGRLMLKAAQVPGKVRFTKRGQPYIWWPHSEEEAEDLYHKLWCQRSLKVCCLAG